ncbi:hypothetical protein ACMA1I_21335 [Pontibacter sp. 13R65]|uniref:hypothetical protein n=1 Tax=Pontibacter sp. 13R65 TaxID=3127458 RepID=UPI00301D345B
MEKLIIIYCLLIILLMLVVLGLLIWEKQLKARFRHFSKEKCFLAIASMVGFMLLHLNWTFLPWYISTYGDLASIGIFMLLSKLCMVPLFYLFKTSRSTKKSRPWSIYINTQPVNPTE